MDRANRNKRIRQRREDGLTYRELSEEFGLCEDQVFRIVKQNPPAVGGLDVKWAKVRELWMEGHKAKQIAEELDICLAAVYRALRFKNGRKKR